MSYVDPEGKQSTSEFKRNQNPSAWKRALERIRKTAACCLDKSQCGKDPADVDYPPFSENNESPKYNETVKEDVP